MSKALHPEPTPWRNLLIVCRKCGKKLDGEGFGPGGADSLARALKTELRRDRRRDVRVIETKCLGLCPKRAVAVVTSRDPGTILAVPSGTPVEAVLGRLGA